MTEKKAKREKKISIEELYQNKNFVPPKEKNLETIFEEPRKSKDGAPILTSVRKYRRYLHFDPTEGKIQKRKLKAKKCVNKLKPRKLRTRSATTKAVDCGDISLYILDAIGESSSDSEAMDMCNTSHPHQSKTGDSSGNPKSISLVSNDRCDDETVHSETRSELGTNTDGKPRNFQGEESPAINIQETSEDHKCSVDDKCGTDKEVERKKESRGASCIVN